jgi:serine/threonine protein kinase
MNRQNVTARSIAAEVRTMRLLQGNPHTACLHCALTLPRHVLAVMAYVPGGELLHRVLRCRLTEREAKHCINAVTSVICQLHNEGMMYRDVKPENILLMRGGTEPLGACDFRVVDFGLCMKAREEDGTLYGMCGTRSYAAPEMNTQRYTNAVDMW